VKHKVKVYFDVLCQKKPACVKQLSHKPLPC